MSTTHTPGPWIVRHLTGFPLMIATAPDADGFGEPVADCSRHHLPAQAMCNARLIAAAPDLLAVLCEAVQVCGFALSGPTDSRAAEDGEPAWVCAARAAIAKAESR
jgi:hypothetical protein